MNDNLTPEQQAQVDYSWSPQLDAAAAVTHVVRDADGRFLTADYFGKILARNPEDVEYRGPFDVWATVNGEIVQKMKIFDERVWRLE